MPVGWLDLPGLGDPVRAFIGWQETAAIFVVILIIFGPKSIPEVARMLGKFMAQFREAASELQRNLYIDDVKEIQRELRDSWKTKPERMRTVKPGAEHDTEPQALELETTGEDATADSSATQGETEVSETPETSQDTTEDNSPEEGKDRDSP